MRKIIAILIPAALIAVFILIMLSASFLKEPFGEYDDIQAIAKELKTDINNGDWSEAREQAERLETAWDIITDRVQFSAERDELRDAKTSIARMKGYIEAADRAGSLAELGEVKERWTDIGQ